MTAAPPADLGPETEARLRAHFRRAAFATHNQACAILGVRWHTLRADGDAEPPRVRFALSAAGRRLYAEAALRAYVARLSAAPRLVTNDAPPPKRRRRAGGSATVLDFQAKAARVRADRG